MKIIVIFDEECTVWSGARGSVVVEELDYKPECRGFETR
jgi:hypothetical protein